MTLCYHTALCKVDRAATSHLELVGQVEEVPGVLFDLCDGDAAALVHNQDFAQQFLALC